MHLQNIMQVLWNKNGIDEHHPEQVRTGRVLLIQTFQDLHDIGIDLVRSASQRLLCNLGRVVARNVIFSERAFEAQVVDESIAKCLSSMQDEKASQHTSQ